MKRNFLSNSVTFILPVAVRTCYSWHAVLSKLYRAIHSYCSYLYLTKYVVLGHRLSIEVLKWEKNTPISATAIVMAIVLATSKFQCYPVRKT